MTRGRRRAALRAAPRGVPRRSRRAACTRRRSGSPRSSPGRGRPSARRRRWPGGRRARGVAVGPGSTGRTGTGGTDARRARPCSRRPRRARAARRTTVPAARVRARRRPPRSPGPTATARSQVAELLDRRTAQRAQGARAGDRRPRRMPARRAREVAPRDRRGTSGGGSNTPVRTLTSIVERALAAIAPSTRPPPVTNADSLQTKPPSWRASAPSAAAIANVRRRSWNPSASASPVAATGSTSAKPARPASARTARPRSGWTRRPGAESTMSVTCALGADHCADALGDRRRARAVGVQRGTCRRRRRAGLRGDVVRRWRRRSCRCGAVGNSLAIPT